MIRAINTIRGEKVYKPGELIEGFLASEEERLVRLGAAAYVVSPHEELQQVQKPVEAIDPALFNELKQALDENYNAEELKKAAKEVGVDLTGLTRKDDIIEAVINQGKADELLEDEEPGELDE